MKILTLFILLTSFNIHAGEFIYKKSEFDKLHKIERINGFTEFMSYERYLSFIKSAKEDSKYIIYVETNTKGDRRVLLANRSNGMKRTIKTGRTLKDFKKWNTKNLMKDRRLLSLHIINVNGIDMYSAVWVNYRNYSKEQKKLKRMYGISSPINTNKING